MDGWMNRWMDVTSLGSKSILTELIQIKYEGKIIKLIDHVNKYLHVLRGGQDFLNKPQNHSTKMGPSV